MTPDLQTRIAAIKAECEEIIRLDKVATAGPWGVIDSCMAPDAEFVIRARNVSPAMARIVLTTIQKLEECNMPHLQIRIDQSLESIASKWEGK